ncbi:cation:proton antiporter [Mesoterricola sediminis]|uniref:Cation/H+ exchanger transmembrane domain-containing protein n=1 Tax=Mesoterricola sediminis TaxID=2927980 RepID=A0AA48GZW6_9BACT|nr:cation:proton antiporter [Mesoterricola sediminis]BDU77102.1 hypothetical protein METESE_20600 [Mesoterricola sediminis]
MSHAVIPTLALSVLAAFVAALVVIRFRLPVILAYLVAGMAVGPHTPGFVANGEVASELAEVGIMLLMFGVGLHFSLKDLRRVWRVAVPGAVLQLTVATVLGVWLASAWGWPRAAGWIFGLSLSCASTVVLLRNLSQARLEDRPEGHLAIGWLLVEDLVCVLVLLILPTLGGLSTSGGAFPWKAAAAAVGGLALKLGVLGALMAFAGAKGVRWLLHETVRHDSRELFTLALVAVSVGFAFLAATWFQVSYALGAFLAGILINGLPISQRIRQDIQPLQDIFTVLFFISVGMLFDPAILVRRPGAVVLTTAVILAGKALAAYGIVRVLGKDRRTAMTVAVGLSQIGEFSFILAALGLRTGLLPAVGQQLVLAGAILSIALNPFLFKFIDRAKAA